MARSDGYNTRARNMMLEYLKQNCSTTVSVQDILGYLKEQEYIVNRTTVYRYLGKLCDEHLVIRYTDQEADKSVFQYIGENQHCHEHLHLKCVVCDKVIHLDCGFMDTIKTHLMKDHNFELQCEGSMLYGICEDCRKKRQKLN